MLVMQSLKHARKATAVHFALIVLRIIVARDPTDDQATLLAALMRWARVVTVVVTLILDSALKQNAKMLLRRTQNHASCIRRCVRSESTPETQHV